MNMETEFEARKKSNHNWKDHTAELIKHYGLIPNKPKVYQRKKLSPSFRNEKCSEKGCKESAVGYFNLKPCCEKHFYRKKMEAKLKRNEK